MEPSLQLSSAAPACSNWRRLSCAFWTELEKRRSTVPLMRQSQYIFPIILALISNFFWFFHFLERMRERERERESMV